MRYHIMYSSKGDNRSVYLLPLIEMKTVNPVRASFADVEI